VRGVRGTRASGRGIRGAGPPRTGGWSWFVISAASHCEFVDRYQPWSFSRGSKASAISSSEHKCCWSRIIVTANLNSLAGEGPRAQSSGSL
jgi:hypothetical protein